MTHHKCPHCATGMMEELAYGKTVKIGRRAVHVDGLLKFVCSACSGETVTRAQFKSNRQRAAEAVESANSKIVNADFLRALRERYQISQRTASQLFGAGESSFAKWESEQTSVSTPTSLLIRCAAEFPDVINYLSELSGVTLEIPASCSADPIHETTGDASLNVNNNCVVLEFPIRQSVEIVSEEKLAIYNPVEYRGTRTLEMGIAK